MPGRSSTYSRVVAWLKIILPLAALAILSTVFLVARRIDPAQTLPLADIDVDALVREQAVGGPHFSTVTADGAAISLSAVSARPDPENPRRILGTGVAADISLPDGRRLAFRAGEMRVDTKTATAMLGGGVTATSPDGFMMWTDAVEFSLKTATATSTGEIRLSARLGSLTSGKFVLTGDGSPGTPYLLVFKNKVRLLYRPEG